MFGAPNKRIDTSCVALRTTASSALPTRVTSTHFRLVFEAAYPIGFDYGRSNRRTANAQPAATYDARTR